MKPAYAGTTRFSWKRTLKRPCRGFVFSIPIPFGDLESHLKDSDICFFFQKVSLGNVIAARLSKFAIFYVFTPTKICMLMQKVGSKKSQNRNRRKGATNWDGITQDGPFHYGPFWTVAHYFSNEYFPQFLVTPDTSEIGSIVVLTIFRRGAFASERTTAPQPSRRGVH